MRFCEVGPVTLESLPGDEAKVVLSVGPVRLTASPEATAKMLDRLEQAMEKQYPGVFERVKANS